MPRGRQWVAVVSAARSSVFCLHHPHHLLPHGRAALVRASSAGGAPPSPALVERVALPPVPQSAPGSARRPPLGVRCVQPSCPSGRSYPCLGASPSISARQAHSQGPCAWSGLFAGAPRCPFRAPGPGATGPPRGTPRAGALATLGTAVVATLRFFSAGAACSGQGLRGFPPGAVARGLPPSTPARAPASATHFLTAPGARGDPVAVLGALPLRPSRGAHRPPPCTPGRPDAGGGVFHGIIALRHARFGPLARSSVIKKHK